MKKILTVAWFCFVLTGSILAAESTGDTDALARGFGSPPESARPWVYWFALDGNLSRNGITADLEAMKRAGIGGVLYMETDQGAPKGPARFGGPLWRELFKHICSEANRLGLKVNVNNDAGWCGSGGPWITPELSMQRVVWTETVVAGPRRFDERLPQPKAVKDFYRDIAVFAYPTPTSDYRIPGIEGKSAAVREEIPLRASFPPLAAGAAVARDRIVNITARLDAAGRLDWDVPEGKWTLLRLGHTSTGKDNHPAPLEGRGLECDKLSKEAAEVMFSGLVARLVEDSKPLAGEGKTLVSTHIDSWEVGSQNWTPLMREEFLRLRGYDPLPYLPVMTGRVVDSLEVSERFLWDLRQTINDLVLDNYAGHFREMAHRLGIRLSIEGYDFPPVDDMTYAGRADEPMAEFWRYIPYFGADWCMEMASAAHTYGKPVLGAEAFTSTDAEKWQVHPGLMKTMGDWAFCEGINRFVFHRYALQPWTNPDRRPGMSMGPWGIHYERTQTWWEKSKTWHEYLTRCQFLLQQGLFVADLCFLEPETNPQRFRSPVKSGRERPGYNFDGCSPEVVLTRMSVKDGRLVLPDGMSYRLLVLPRVDTMTPRLLRRIKELVADGATVVGSPPLKSPGLSGYPRCDAEVKALARELWGEGDPPVESTERPFGKGRIIWGGEYRPRAEPVYGAVNPLASTNWIWSREKNPFVTLPAGKRFFRRTVATFTGVPVVSANFRIIADGPFECWVNGQRVGAGDDHRRMYTLDIAPMIRPGKNLVGVAAAMRADSPNHPALVAKIAIRYLDGRTQEISTDAAWETAFTVKEQWASDIQAAEGWEAVRVFGPYGVQPLPWGEIDGMPMPDPIPDVNIICRLLAKQGVAPDFDYRAKNSPQGLRYIHKRIGDTEVYFVANKNPHAEEALCSFRVQGRRPEFWRPQTGRIERPAVYDEGDGVTRVPIRFDPSGSVFVVFRAGAAPEADRIVSLSRNGKPLLSLSGKNRKQGIGREPAADPKLDSIELARGDSGQIVALIRQTGTFAWETANGERHECKVPSIPDPLEIAGPWELSFPPMQGAPERVTLQKLISWSDHADPGVRFFSGTATYSGKIYVPADRIKKNLRMDLDLGDVQVMADVSLNGIDLGTLWKPPFRVDVTRALKAGGNLLEIKVVNLWINRMIGDEQLPEDSRRNPDGTLAEWPQWLNGSEPSGPTGRITFTSWRLWPKDVPLEPSGLLGPVFLTSSVRMEVK